MPLTGTDSKGLVEVLGIGEEAAVNGEIGGAEGLGRELFGPVVKRSSELMVFIEIEVVGQGENKRCLGVEFGFLQVIKDPVYLGTTMPAVIGDKPAEYYSPKTIDPVLGLGITVYDRI